MSKWHQNVCTCDTACQTDTLQCCQDISPFYTYKTKVANGSSIGTLVNLGPNDTEMYELVILQVKVAPYKTNIRIKWHRNVMRCDIRVKLTSFEYSHVSCITGAFYIVTVFTQTFHLMSCAGQTSTVTNNNKHFSRLRRRRRYTI